MPLDDPRPFSFVEDELADQMADADNVEFINNFEIAEDDELSDFENFASDDEEEGNGRRLPRPPNSDYILLSQRPPEENQQQQPDERPVNRHGRHEARQPEVLVQWIPVEQDIFSEEEQEEFRRRRNNQQPESSNVHEHQSQTVTATTSEQEVSSSNRGNQDQTAEVILVQPDINISVGPSCSNKEITSVSSNNESISKEFKDQNKLATKDVQDKIETLENKLKIDSEKEEVIKNLMSNFKLPTESIPPWANEISEDTWKQLLHDKFNNKNTTD